MTPPLAWSRVRVAAFVGCASVLATAVPNSALAYKTKTHVAAANELIEILDEQINQTNPMLEFRIEGEEPLFLPITRTEAYDAILQHVEHFRAGVIGPDGFPDPITGQMLAHGNGFDPVAELARDIAGQPAADEFLAGTDYDRPFQDRHGPSEYRAIDHAMRMLQYWSGEYSGDNVQRAQALAFIVGYIAHGVGDTFAHTWVNELAEGAWELGKGRGLYGSLTEEIKHVAIESLVNDTVPSALVSEAARPQDLEKVQIRAPEHFLDRYFSAQTPNAHAVGSRTGDADAFLEYYKQIDRFQGGMVYNYLNAQVDMVDALKHWSRLGPFFNLAEFWGDVSGINDAARILSYVDKLNFPQELLEDLGGWNPSQILTFGVANCQEAQVLDWLTTGLGETLSDITWFTQMNDRIDAQRERALVARQNWVRLNECTSENLAKTSAPNWNSSDPTRNTDACVDVARQGWQSPSNPGGLYRGNIGTSNEEDVEFLVELRSAFLGAEPDELFTDPESPVAVTGPFRQDKTPEFRSDHRKLEPNVDRLFDYLTDAGFTLEHMMEVFFPSDLARDWRSEFDQFCDAVSDHDTENCIDLALAPVAHGAREIRCQGEHAACVAKSQKECVQVACGQGCAATLPFIESCGSWCSGSNASPQGKCRNWCNDKLAWCKWGICVPKDFIIGGIGFASCKVACSFFDDRIDDCATSGYEVAECGLESVKCSFDNVRDTIMGNNGGREILRPFKEFCDATKRVVEMFDCLDGRPGLTEDELWAERRSCTLDMCVQTLASPIGKPAVSRPVAEERCERNVNEVFDMLDSVRATQNAVHRITDTLADRPSHEFVNMAFLWEDLHDPAYRSALASRLTSACSSLAPPDLDAKRDTCDRFNDILSDVTRLPATAPAEPSFFDGLDEELPLAEEVQRLTEETADVLQAAQDLGLITLPAGPTARRILREVGPNFSDTFTPYFNTIQGMKLAPMIGRDDQTTSLSSADALLSVDPSLWQQSATTPVGSNDVFAYSEICRSTAFAHPLCDVMQSFDDPNCLGGDPRVAPCKGGNLLMSINDGAEAWSVARGLYAFNEDAAPNEHTRFPYASDADANEFGYDRMFRGNALIKSAMSFRGDALRSGFSPVAGPLTTASTRTEGLGLWSGSSSSPVVAPDGTIFFGGDDGNVYALNPDFSVKWQYRSLDPRPVQSSGYLANEPAPGGGRRMVLYIGGSRGLSLNALLKLDAETGNVIWHFGPLGLARIKSSPLVSADGSAVYFGTDGNRVYALRTSDGGQIWNHDVSRGLLSLGQQVTASVAQGPDGTLYASSTDGHITALRPDAGLSAANRVRWFKHLGGAINGTPAVGFGQDPFIYAGTTADELVAVRSTNGQIVWRAHARAPVWNLLADISSSPAATPDGLVFFGGNDNWVQAVNAATGQQVWEYQLQGSLVGGITADRNGTVYFGTNNGTIYALRSEPGLTRQQRTIWTITTGFLPFLSPVKSAPTIAPDGTLLITTTGAPYLIAVDPALAVSHP